MLLEICFKKALYPFFGSKAVKSQQDDHFFIKSFISGNDMDIWKKFFAEKIDNFQRILFHAINEPRSSIPQGINIIPGYIIRR